MLFNALTIGAAVFASTAVAKIIPIDVGKVPLTFSPNITTASQGDVLEFTFFSKNHSVVQGPFTSPCSVGSLTPSFFSGFMPTASESTTKFSVTVNSSTAPLWIYCAQTVGSHCQNGMAMVVNQPVGANSLAAYVAGAKNTTISSIPSAGKAVGGTFSTSNSTGTGSGSGTTTSPPSSTSSAAASTSSHSAANGMMALYDMMAVGAVSVGAIVFGVAL